MAWQRVLFLETKDALLTRLAGAGKALDRWLETRSLSPRERQIATRVPLAFESDVRSD
jgi:hypothetical protein